MPKIAVIYEATVSGFSATAAQAMLPAFTHQWNQDLQKIWGVDTAAFTFYPAGKKPAAGDWWLVFLNDSDQAGALAYHDLTNEGLPISKIFVDTILKSNTSVSVGATHELCEMAVDPWLNSAYQDPKGKFWAGEVCDPVEDDQYGYQIGDVLVTDFITPNWFAHQSAQGPIDFKTHAKAAFEVLSGGYAQWFDSKKGWEQVTGSKAALMARVTHPAQGSRRERRARRTADPASWKPSTHVWH
jgi:hypothetical protein